jgi:hypothetical protein
MAAILAAAVGDLAPAEAQPDRAQALVASRRPPAYLLLPEG